MHWNLHTRQACKTGAEAVPVGLASSRKPRPYCRGLKICLSSSFFNLHKLCSYGPPKPCPFWAQSPLHSRKLTWKPKKGPIKTTALLKGDYMEGCQNYGPFLGTLNIRGRIIIGTQQGTIILTTNHMGFHVSLGECICVEAVCECS